MTTNTEPPGWCGWWRAGTGHAWTELLAADSEAEAWSKLLALVKGGDLCVLPQGRSPNEGRGGRSYYRHKPGRSFTENGN